MEREQLLKVMVPVGAFALLLILVAGVVALNSGGRPPATPAVVPPADGTQPLPPSPAEASGAVAKYDFPLDGPEWKEVAGKPGLKFWDVREGTGKECPPGASVSAHYTGWRTDGGSFDSSRKHGSAPVPFSLNGVVAGWTYGLPGMKVGGVRRLFIPSALGYGAQNKGRDLPPHTDLIFEVELTGVN